MATSPLPSRGPQSGEKSIWLHHPCLLGVPIVGRVQYGSPLPSRGPHSGEKSIWLHHPCLLGVPIVGRNQYGYITPALSGSMVGRVQCGYSTHAFSRSLVGRVQYGGWNGEWIKMVENGQKWVFIQMCHIPNAWEAKKKPSMEPKTCQKGPKVGFEYLPPSKTLHCVHGIPSVGCQLAKRQPTISFFRVLSE